MATFKARRDCFFSLVYYSEGQTITADKNPEPDLFFASDANAPSPAFSAPNPAGKTLGEDERGAIIAANRPRKAARS